MPRPLDDLYLEWLYSQVASVRLKNPSKTYWHLIRALYSTEFVWLIPNDDNRLEDGRDLRAEFIKEAAIDDVDQTWLTIGCSLMEMLVGLSRRLVFESEVETGVGDWFWHLLSNIELAELNDRLVESGPHHEQFIFHMLHQVIWRTYQSDGFGGLFPLRDPREDQRKVELWYQLSNYLLEGNTV